MRADAAALAEIESQDGDTKTQTRPLLESFHEAETAYLEAIDFTPNGPSDYVNLAALYNLVGATIDPAYYQDAINTVRLGLEVMPLDIFLRERLAEAYVATGHIDKATEVLEFCVELDAGATDAALSLAKLYQEQGMVDEAIAVLEAAEARVPGHPLLMAAIEVLRKGKPLP